MSSTFFTERSDRKSVKQSDGSKVCSCCGDERGIDADRDCPCPIVAQPGKSPLRSLL